MSLISRVLEFDPATGTTEIHHYDPDTDKTIIETRQDLKGIAEHNSNLHRLVDERERFGGDGLGPRVAVIPNIVLAQLMREGRLHDQRAMKRWLNDKENQWVRVRPGRV